MSDGPVCHIAPPATKVDPQPVAIPSIPPAQPNIASLLHTVNTMRQVINILIGQQGSQGRPGATGKTGQANNAKGTWTEEGRVIETVRVFQNNDPTSDNWVDVERINKLVMNNKDTKQTWSWDRDRK